MRGEEERPELASYLIILGGVEEGIRASGIRSWDSLGEIWCGGLVQNSLRDTGADA